MIKTSYIALLLGISTITFGQSEEEAFSKSYAHEKSAQYADAINDIKAFYNPANYELNLRTGYLYYMNKQYKESQNYYEKAIALMPYSIEAKLGIVLPLTELGNWNMISTEYNDILKIDPQNSTANYALGYIYYNNKDYATALKYFEKVVNLYPFTYYGLLMDGWAHLQLGKYNEAKILFNKVLLISPGDASAKQGLGMIK